MFVIVGIAATALVVFIITLFIRRRRAKAFDREVQDAAREAALAQAPVDDDEYGGASYNTHASQPMSTERDRYGYGSSNASSWDPYARGVTGATIGGYEMHQRRTSTGTAPGMAGFASGDSFARAVGVDQPQGYNQPQGYGPGYGQQQAYANQGYNQGYSQQQQGYQQYNNTSPQQTYQLAQERGPARPPPQARMMMPEAQNNPQQNYNTVDAYRSSPSYGQAHPGEQVEYGHAYSGEETDRPRQSEDPYGGYETYDYGSTSNNHASGSGNNARPPAYAPGLAGNAGATGDRKGGATLAREPSGKSADTRYSQDDSDGSADEQPTRRVLKVANQ